VPDATAATRATRITTTPSVAVVGLACRFPDADDPAALLDVVLTGRRSFRRLPSARIDLADYYQADLTTTDATYSTRAGLIEGWQFECDAFGIEPASYAAADPAHWLALETTARALAAAGLPAGTGLDRDRTGVIIGNTLTGDTSRANALRVRWPYVRRVLTEALDTQEIPASQAGLVLRNAETSYLAPFPAMGPGSLAGSLPATIATGIGSYFGFRGGSHAVDSACSSSLQAIASACAALAAGDLDAAIAGGVDISLDPLELIGLAKAGVLATTDVRIYDRDPSGYLPGEGCGVVVLMRTADARAADLPVYAEILGWGTSGGDARGETHSHASTQLLAMQRAYERAGVDPADIQFMEGNGAGTPADDVAELSALSTLRAGAKQRAALGSIKANIGHAKAAAGAAGLIKTVLALGTGVVPPTTGVHMPHELITSGDAGLILPQAPADWPSGSRLAAVSALGIGGSNVHVVLRHEPASRTRQDKWLRSVPALAKATPRQSPEGVQSRLQPEPEPTPFLLHAPDIFALSKVLARLADVAGSMSDAEMQDFACLLGRDAGPQGRARVALVATRQEQLAALAKEAITLLPQLADGLITVRPGIFASDDADGRVTLLLSGDAVASSSEADSQPGPVALTSAVAHCLDALRWLESLEVHATCAVGHGLGALAGLAWAGVLGETEVVEIADLRAQFLLRAAARAEIEPGAPGSQTASLGDGLPGERSGAAELRAAIAQRFRFGPPRRRLISTMTGAEIDSVDDAIDLICSGFGGAEHISEAVADGAIGATLLVETGPGRTLVSAAAKRSRMPAVSLRSGFADPMNSARVAAALFAAGAIGLPRPLFAGRPARPVDIWREQVFITNPCEVSPLPSTTAPSATGASATGEPTLDDEDGISSKREELERQLPARPLIEAASDQPADTGQAADSAELAQAELAEADLVAAEPTEAEPTEPEAELTEDPQAETQPVAAADPAVPAEASVPDEAVPDEAVPGEAVPDEAAAPDAAPVLGKRGAASKPGAPKPVMLKPAVIGKPVVLGEPVVASKATAKSQQSSAEPPLPTQNDRDHVSDGIAAPAASAPGEPDYAIAVSSGRAIGPVDGLGPWARCFTETLRPARPAESPAQAQSWRMYAAARGPVLADVSSVFTADPAADRTLAIVEDPADQRSQAAALEAARDAITTGELVVLTTSAEFTGFFASLHAEHPSIGVTVVRLPADPISPDAIIQYASAELGQFRELIIAPTGAASEPVPAEVELTSGGDCPLGPDDVILISRGTRGAGLALAQVLACCGTGIAVLGRAGEHDDAELVAGLEKLRSAGARVGYEVIDIGDEASLAAAVRRVEDRLGPVTALAHAASVDEHVPVLELADNQVSSRLADEISTLDKLAGSIRAGQLKLIITFGTVAERYGLAGATVSALSRGALASRAAELAATGISSRHMHVDMAAWSSGGLGDRPELATELAAADAPALDVATASRMLLKVLTTPGLGDRIALHGRVGGLPALGTPVISAADLTAAGLPHGGRFLRKVAVHYPGIELICSARLSLRTDPYLADYRIDGMPVLPPVLALEALAQVASVLAGRPMRRAVDVTLDSPVLIPSGGEAVVRICALRDGDRIMTVLRCADSSYRIDHASAEFSCAQDVPDMPDAALSAASSALHQLVAGPSGLVDGAELYGPISFQSGRFRRIALLPEVTARSGRALARGSDEHPWYPSGSELADTTFLLGSPGLNDAALQVLQACVPHRRVRLAACESVQFTGRSADGPVEIRAVAEPVRVVTGGGEPADAAAIERTERGAAETADQALVPGQPGAPDAEKTRGRAQTSEADEISERTQISEPAQIRPVRPAAAAVAQADMTAEELADMEIGERRPQSRKSRRGDRRQPGDRRQAGGRGPERSAGTSYPALHTWEVPASALRKPASAHGETSGALPSAPAGPAGAGTSMDDAITAPAARRGAAPTRRILPGWAAPQPDRGQAPLLAQPPAPQLWNIDAVDAAGQLIATWRGVRLHDSGPLPRNAAWPPTLLSVFLERCATDLGLDEGLRVTVSCGQPDDLLTNAVAAVPSPAPPADSRPPGGGRHAGPERRAMNAVTAPGTGALAGFALTLRAPVPVACGWVTVDSARRQHEPAAGMAAAYAQLRAETSESPEVLAARLDAVAACMTMADVATDDPAADRLAVIQTTGEGWAVFALGRARIACVVAEMSGVSAPVAIAVMTRQYAHRRRATTRTAAPVSAS
jgi:enediyne polyketide synthase